MALATFLDGRVVQRFSSPLQDDVGRFYGLTWPSTSDPGTHSCCIPTA